ncbi:hypothetical protein GCK32_001454 [Trichostrongylus colubriformis]|uniref:Uncharacterized protein n=1 Tax=Trichostrongylus colubriformis TaxID=6319 RepID=A0AAN8F5N9_TRICO
MRLLYPNLPWIINDSEYNCSGRSLSEWGSRGSVNEVQGIYFAVSGTIFVIIYVLCLIGMVRGNLLNIPCYCLMFFNGFIDIMDIIAGSFLPAYFHLNGAVLCSSFTVNWIAGYFSWAVWCGATFNCVVLALNRVAEMIPSARFLRFLFRGNFLRLWMVLCVAYIAIQPFIHRTHPFNTTISAYINSPMIVDDVQKAADFTIMLVPIQNVTIVVVLLSLYSLLCFHVLRIPHFAKGSHYKFQVKLFVQALLICMTTAITSFLYVLLAFFSLSRSIVITMNIIWQLSHGLHGIIYFCFNRSIRNESLGGPRELTIAAAEYLLIYAEIRLESS